MIRIQQIKVPLQHTDADIEKKIKKILNLKQEQTFTYRIWKRSIDARRKNEVSYVYTVDVEIPHEQKLLNHIKNKNILPVKERAYECPMTGTKRLKHRPVVVGSGPAGLFCAYQLALCGYAPLVIERGKQADERKKDVDRFWETGILDTASNVQFGEGGAGTFSDGKLNTLVKDTYGRSRYVLETFVKCGAGSDILYVSKPHIGTDVLIDVVQRLRAEILRLGGSFQFETCLCDIHVEDGRLLAITAASDAGTRRIDTELLVLAVGHSARDTFAMLHEKKLSMEAKPFAVGFRVEHPQHMMDAHQYKGADMRYLPAASYKVTANFENQRGVYSFCMCPGGYVVNASSEEGRLAVNGMSYHKRDGKNANSAIIVSVTPADFPDKSPLGGVAFQRELEARAFALGAGKIPQQLYGDYVAGRLSAAYGAFASQTKGAAAFADLSALLPQELKHSFIRGMERFSDFIPQFNRYDAILSGVESRTSSPVRIPRDEDGQGSIRGIYPCGEGAGYAGGIMSAAMDGLKVAEHIAAAYAPTE